MSRNEQLERILKARYELDDAPRALKAAHWKALCALVDQAIESTGISRHELLHAIHDVYIEYKRERRRQETLSLARRLRSR